MTISYVSGASAESTSISSMPSHQRGDLLLICAYNSANTTRVTIPSGWVPVAMRATNAQAAVIAYKVAASAAETSGTWTNATAMACAVYRHGTNEIHVGGFNSNSSAGTTTVNYAAITTYALTTTGQNMSRQQSGDEWFVGFAGVASNSTDIETPPSGMTNRINRVGSGAREIAVHDTNGNVSSWASTNVTISGSAAYMTLVVEIYDSGVATSTSSGIRTTRSLNGGYNA